MIKVIKEGKIPEHITQKYKVTCNLCGCVFEFESSDFEIQDRCMYGNGYISCPTCQQRITVSKGGRK